MERKIADAFLIFDHHGNKTADVREIGTILRFLGSIFRLLLFFTIFKHKILGCVPSEQEVNEVISATEFEDSNGTVHLSKFLPHVAQLLEEHKKVSIMPYCLIRPLLFKKSSHDVYKTF